MTTNKSQYTLTTQWIVPEDKKSEVESFFAEHEVWMRETHNLSGNDEPRNIRCCFRNIKVLIKIALSHCDNTSV